MKKNYYELLEVNENASKEVIEKAYRVLAKRYHPDVQPRENLLQAEEEFKQIALAYSVLSDPESRIVYDFENGFTNSKKEYQNRYDQLYIEQEKLKEELSSLKSNSAEPTPTKNKRPYNLGTFKTSLKSIAQGLYNETSKNNQYRNKNIKALILTIIFMTVLIFVFWNIPFIRNFLFP